jgi:hypothetical protein
MPRSCIGNAVERLKNISAALRPKAGENAAMRVGIRQRGQAVSLQVTLSNREVGGRVLGVRRESFGRLAIDVLVSSVLLPDTDVVLRGEGLCLHCKIHYCIGWGKAYRVTALN